jgi:hypothetical protein
MSQGSRFLLVGERPSPSQPWRAACIWAKPFTRERLALAQARVTDHSGRAAQAAKFLALKKHGGSKSSQSRM